MQADRIEKIKRLVQSSGLLNQAEKQEWLGLLGLMNDKQLLELERILAPSKSANQEISKSANQPAVIGKPLAKDLGPKFQSGLSFAMPAIKPELPAVLPSKPVLPKQAPTPAVVKPVSPVSPVPANLPVSPKFSPAPGLVKPELKENFHHILNLPRVNSPEKPGLLPKTANDKKIPPLAKEFLNKPAAAPVSASVKPEAAQTGFFKKLKEILNEKELPAPKIPSPPKVESAPLPVSGTAFSSPANKPNEPKAVSTQSAPAPLLAPKVDDKKVLDPAKQKTGFLQNLFVKPSGLPPALVKSPAVDLAAAAPKKAEIEKKPPALVASPSLPQTQTSKTTISQLAQKLEKEAMQRRQPGAGIKLISNTAEVEAELIQSAKQPQDQKAAVASEPARGNSAGANAAPVHYDSLEKLAGFDRKALNSNLEAVTKSLAALIKRFGYHQVIFGLEKSPAYKAYINSGVLMLSNQNAPQWQDTAQTLSKNEFENFADILRQIQAG